MELHCLIIGSLIISWTVHVVLLVWFSGSLFSSWRSQLEALKDVRWWAKLLTCSLCLSVWVTTLATVTFILINNLCETWHDWLILPFYIGSSLFLTRVWNGLWTVNPAEE